MTSKKTLSYLIFVLVGAAVLFSFLFFLSPKIGQILTLQSRQKAQKEKLAKLTFKLNSLEKLDLFELENQSKVALTALPAEGDASYLMYLARSLVAEAGLSLDDLQFDLKGLTVSATASSALPRSKTANLPVISWKMEIAGTFDQLKELMENMKKIAPIIQVVVVNLELKTPEAMTAVVEVESHFLPLPETLGEVEKPLELINNEEQIAYQKVRGLKTVPAEALAPVSFGKANPFLP